jgi:hypothetical protein
MNITFRMKHPSLGEVLVKGKVAVMQYAAKGYVLVEFW